MPSIDRRAFLAGLAAVPTLRVATAAARAPVNAFVAESGKRGAWPLVVGLLATSAPDAHELQIELLRRRHAYSRTLRYMSTDRNKVAFASAVIDYAAGAGDLSFAAVVVRDPGGKWQTTGDGRDAAYAAIYRRLIEMTESGEIVIRLRRGNGDRRDMALRAYLTGDLGLVTKPCGRSNLAELAAFLSGCVYGEATGIDSPIKRALIERLRRQIDGPAKFSLRTAGVGDFIA